MEQLVSAFHDKLHNEIFRIDLIPTKSRRKVKSGAQLSRQCAPLWPTAQLNFYLSLTTYILLMLPTKQMHLHVCGYISQAKWEA
jgi:hypothetical protein